MNPEPCRHHTSVLPTGTVLCSHDPPAGTAMPGLLCCCPRHLFPECSRWGLMVTSSKVYPVQAQRSMGLGSRKASVFLSCPSDIHRAAPLLRQCVLQRQAKDPQAVYLIQGKEVRVPVQLIMTLVRPWCCSNGSGSYKTKMHFTGVPKKRKSGLPCYGYPKSLGPL